MKKNLLCVLLSLVMVLGLMVIAAPNAFATEGETTEPAAHSHCVCVNSAAKPADHVCDETIVWEPYVKGMTLVDGGHYYLTADTGEARNLTNSSNKLNITICLNGHTFRAQTPFKVQNGNTLTICDCAGGGAIRSSQAKGTGYSVWAGYNKGVINLYSGILSGQVNTGVFARPVVVEGGTFNMYGGTIKNGDSGTITTGSPNVGYGGNVLIKNFVGQSTHVGTFNLYGGTIEGGKATVDGGNIYVEAGKFTMSGGTVSGGTAVNGGNIATNGNGRKVDLTLSGGIIENGVATGNGGNIYMLNTTNGTVLSVKENAQILNGSAVNGGNIYQDKGNPSTISGGTISGGTASADGGNIYLTKDMTISGGVIENGTATDEGGNLYISAGSVATISGGSFVGGNAKFGGSIYALNDVTLTGVSISEGTATGNGGNIWSEKVVTIGEGTVISGGSATNGGNICTSGTGANLIMEAGKIENGTATGNGGNAYTYNCSLVKITGGEVSNGEAKQGGNLYITHTTQVATRRLTISDATITGGNATEGAGGNLYASRVGEIKLTDVTMNGGVATTSGSNIFVQLSNQITISGGNYSVDAGNRNYTYDSEKHGNYTQDDIQTYGLNAPGTRISGKGGNICISSIQDFTKETKDDEGNVISTETIANSGTISGASILGGNAVDGGALYIGSGTVTLDGITAKSCGGESGRVLHVAKAATVTLKDSTMVNWGTQGSTIYNSGSLTLVGEVKLDKEFNANERKNGTAALTNGIILDVIENEDAMVDISGLTAVVNHEEEGMPTVSGISMTRYGALEGDTKLVTAGKLATGVNDANRGFITINNTGFVLVEENGDLYMNNTAIQGIKADGAITNGGANFAEITANHKPDSVLYYIVNEDITEAGELGISTVLDLNGKTVSGASVAAGYTLQLMENQNDGYDATKCGKITVIGDIEPITHIVPVVGNRHYVALPNEDGSWSAHRYLAYTPEISFAPGADALGFNATYRGDTVLQANLTGYGFQMSVNDGANKIYTKTDPFKNTAHTTLSLRVKNILENNGGEAKITGNAVLVFNINGETVYADTSANSTTMKETVRIVNSMGDDLNEDQKTAVYDLYTKHTSVIDSWFTTEETNYIKTWGPVAE